MYWMSQDAHYKYIKKRATLTMIKIISCACLIQEVTTKNNDLLLYIMSRK